MNEELVKLMVEEDSIDNKQPNEKAEYEGVASIKEECKRVIKTQKKNIVFLAYKQGILFRKLKESTWFMNMVKEIE